MNSRFKERVFNFKMNILVPIKTNKKNLKKKKKHKKMIFRYITYFNYNHTQEWLLGETIGAMAPL